MYITKSLISIVVCVAVIVGIAATASAQPAVVVNGTQIEGGEHLVVIQDVMMMPLTPLAEAIEADYTWDDQERLITITRQGKTVEMWVGFLITTIDGQVDQAEASPFLVDTTIFVPLNFIIRAFEGHVSYDAASRTAGIDLGGAGETQETIQGVIIQVYEGTPLSLLIRNNATNETSVFAVASDAQITRGPAGQQPSPAQPGDLQAGDTISATVVNATVQSVTASYTETAGGQEQPSQLQHMRVTIGGVTGQYLLLEAGEALPVAPEAEILDNQGNPINLGDLQKDDQVLLIVDTGTGNVVRAVREAAAGAPAGDTTPPQFTGVKPVHNETVNDSSTLVRCSYADGDSGINPAATVIIFDHRDVTAEADINARRVEYQAANLADGAHGVDVTITDQAGNTNRNQWTFVVQNPPGTHILSVKHNAQETVGANETIEVTASVARPGGEMTWSIGTIKQDMQMQRVGTSNTYRGSYQVQVGDHGRGRVAVSYTPPNASQAFTAQAEGTVKISGQVPDALKVVQPREGIEPPEELVVKGYAPADTRIRVKVHFEKKLFFDLSHDMDPQIVTVGRDGSWETEPFQLKHPIYGWGHGYKVTVELLKADSDTIIASVTRNLQGK